MGTIIVYKFDLPDGAEKMLNLVKVLSNQRSIHVDDLAIVTWPHGAKKPRTEHLHDMVGGEALGGAFWGMLFGLIFFIPFFGMAVCAAMGALVGKFSDYGIDKEFIRSVSDKVTEGTSALFFMSRDGALDQLSDAIKKQGWQLEIITTNLSKEQEQLLRQDFGTT
ncbi:MAG: DUF1269 domain-containing protein [Anaerolineales bacterium]|jgi:uncharacterized membrane protein